MNTTQTAPQLDAAEQLDLLGALVFALRAALTPAQQQAFRSTLGLIADQARQGQRPALAAALDQLQAAVPPPGGESSTSEPRH